MCSTASGGGASCQRGTDADRAGGRGRDRTIGGSSKVTHGLVLQELTLLRLRALLAHAKGDEVVYSDLRDRYRDMANRLASRGTSRGPRRCHDRAGLGLWAVRN